MMPGAHWDDVFLCDAGGPHLSTLITMDVRIETLRPVADADH